MSLSAEQLLTVSCVILFMVSLAGAWIPNFIVMTHLRIQSAMSLVAGFMIGIAILHLLPHGVSLRGDENALQSITFWVMIGLIVMFVMIRSFDFHQHDHTIEKEVDFSMATTNRDSVGSSSMIGILIGFSMHSLVEGAALAATLQLNLSSIDSFSGIWFAVFMAILLHKPLDAMSFSFLAKTSNLGVSNQYRFNLAFAIMCPLGAMLIYFGLGRFSLLDGEVLPAIIGFSSGAFICIALSDLLPEVHRHAHHRFTLTFMFLLGVFATYLLRILEVSAGLV